MKVIEGIALIVNPYRIANYSERLFWSNTPPPLNVKIQSKSLVIKLNDSPGVLNFFVHSLSPTAPKILDSLVLPFFLPAGGGARCFGLTIRYLGRFHWDFL